MFTRVLQATAVLLLGSQSLGGQGTLPTPAVLEALAARAAIERAIGPIRPNRRIAIDPMLARADAAPGVGDSTRRRDEARNRALAQEFGARLLQHKEVVDCSAPGPCQMKGADLSVTIAEPLISDSTARVTVTTVQQTKRGAQYKTVNVLFKLRATVWAIVGFEDLGIS